MAPPPPRSFHLHFSITITCIFNPISITNKTTSYTPLITSSPPPETGSSSSSQGFMPLCYGSLAMEKSFRECSISPGDSRVAGGTDHNFRSWVGVDSYSLDKTNMEYEIPEEADDDGGELSAQIETLPLFPIHGGTTTGGGSSNHPDIFNVEGGWGFIIGA